MRLRFGEFELDLDLVELRRGAEVRHLEPQVFDVLTYLVLNRDRMVSKEELLDKVWGSRFVSESALTSRIRAARAVVDDNGRDQQVIRTLHGRGYRFVAEVTVAPDKKGAAAAAGALPRPRRESPAGDGPLVLERESELGRLAAALDELRSARLGGVVCVSGAAGLGKTTLVRRAFDDAPQGPVVLAASCDDLSTPRALGPFRDMVLPSGDVLVEGESPTLDVSSVLVRVRTLTATEGPLAIVVEDVHWADDATVDLLRLLVRQAPSLPALLVMTYRDEDLGPRHPMRRLLGSLRAPVVHLPLEPLSTDAVHLLTAGTALDAEQVHAVTGGNPFFVTEIVATPEGALPASVRDAVLARLDHVSDATRHGLQSLSVIPSHVERWLAEGLVDDATTVLSEAERSGLVDGDARTMWFRHELARRVIEADLTTAERAAHHRSAATALAQAHGDPARVLHHAALGGLPSLVRDQALLAAKQAVSAGAHRQAAAHLDVLLSFRDQLPAETVAGAMTDRAHSLYMLNRFAESQRLAEEAVALWERVGDRSQLATALVGLARTGLWARGPRYAERAARRALAAIGDDSDDLLLLAKIHAELARARGNVATVGPVSEPSPEAVQDARTAVGLARRSGRPDFIAHALTYLGAERLSNGDPRGLDDLDLAVQLGSQDPRVEYVTRGCVNASGAAYRAGLPALALDYVRTGLAGCADGEFFAGEYRLELTRCAIHLSSGQWDVAEADLRELVARPGEPGLMRPLAATMLARLLARRGDDEAEAFLASASAQTAGSDEPHLVGPVAAGAAELHWLRGGGDLPSAVTEAFGIARRQGHRVTQAELACYAARCGSPLDVRPEDLPGPWSAAVAGDHQRAAAEWADRDERYEEAVEAWAAGDCDAAAATLTALGARATLARLQRTA